MLYQHKNVALSLPSEKQHGHLESALELEPKDLGALSPWATNYLFYRHITYHLQASCASSVNGD